VLSYTFILLPLRIVSVLVDRDEVVTNMKITYILVIQ
jgi:hypothetical protein